jgi:hypothetical protein
VSIVNRRNAVMGWAAWQIGKRVMRHKAKSAVPKVDLEERRPNKGAIALFAAAVGGLVFFWRRRSGDDDSTDD